ncbi:MAG: polyprenyl synthetase family protein [Anaerolineae bacterium]
MTLRQAQERYQAALDATLRAILVAPSDDFKPFLGMQQYHQGWLDRDLQPVVADPGKRVRPTLCLLCHEACGGDYSTALPLAAAIELEHGFSLVHDDIEDRSPLRRHRETVWALWGEPQAINVGDALFSAAHLALYDLRDSLPPDQVLRLALGFEDVCARLCEGQYLDMAFEKESDVSLDRYSLMIERKTAALISFAAWGGAAAAGADDATVETYRSMGHELGMAFQVQDDILGTWGDERVTGKSASSDIETAKKTLPYLHALHSLPAAEAAELRGLYALDRRDAVAVARARALVERSGARERCGAIAAEHHDRARRLLDEAKPPADTGAALRELIDALSGRQV